MTTVAADMFAYGISGVKKSFLLETTMAAAHLRARAGNVNQYIIDRFDLSIAMRARSVIVYSAREIRIITIKRR